MTSSRLETFSDGVIAIILTIMVLELKIPHGSDLSALRPLIPAYISYVLSFIYIGIYWNNHHHLFQAVQRVNGAILWANMHLLFWLSIVPFMTGWMGESHFAVYPVVCYGGALFMCAVAYYILARTLVKHHRENSVLVKAIGSDFKGKISLMIYLSAISLAFVNEWVAVALYVVVAIMWFVPDNRIENRLTRIEKE
ncbi:MAG: DUF1211 domain-containing protein [Ignavibacteriae bacterium]|nr:DUF1211 domain-containing protein [Ignavibacteriota bacterium]